MSLKNLSYLNFDFLKLVLNFTSIMWTSIYKFRNYIDEGKIKLVTIEEQLLILWLIKKRPKSHPSSLTV